MRDEFTQFIVFMVSLVLIINLVLVGCSTNDTKQIVGDASNWNTPIGLSAIIIIDSPESIEALGMNKGVQGTMYAYSFKMKEQCYVVVPPLINSFSFELLKHELRHCAEGKWH